MYPELATPAPSLPHPCLPACSYTVLSQEVPGVSDPVANEGVLRVRVRACPSLSSSTRGVLACVRAAVVGLAWDRPQRGWPGARRWCS